MSKLIELKKLAGERNRAVVRAALEKLGPRATIGEVVIETGLSRVTAAKHMRAVRGRKASEAAERRAQVAARRAAVAEVLKRLGPETPTYIVAQETGLSWSSALTHIRTVRDSETMGGATDAEIAGRIVAAKANRPPLIPAPKPRPVLSLAAAAVRDYRHARRSLKRGVASYSLLDSRPA